MSTTESTTAKLLRKAVEAKQGPASGTVVVHSQRIPGGYDEAERRNRPTEHRTHVSIFLNGGWQTTISRELLAHEQFTRELAKSTVYDIKLATAWEDVKA